MAKAKLKKAASKAKPVAKKTALAKKKPVPAKKAAPVKKAAPIKAKKPAMAAKKPVALQMKKPAVAHKEAVSAPKAKAGAVQATPANKGKSPAIGPIKGAEASPKLTPMVRPVKSIPIPNEVLKLKDKPQAADSTTSAEKREIHQSDIFSEVELSMFLETLKNERSSLLDKARAAVDSGNIALDKDEMYDEVDLASATVDQNLTYRLLDRDRKLLGEIDHAIQKIQTGDFGYCEGTSEPIPKRRLELRPWCRHSVKYKEQLEKLEKSGRGVVDEDAELLD